MCWILKDGDKDERGCVTDIDGSSEILGVIIVSAFEVTGCLHLMLGCLNSLGDGGGR